MTLELYSSILSIGLIALSAAVAASLIIYAVSRPFRQRVAAVPYRTYMAVLGILAAASIIGAFVYQLYYLTPVCELCWWQRIFLFPTVVIAAVAYMYRTQKAHVMIAILSLLGLFYAFYHYYYHFQGLVMGNVVSLPCSSGGLLPACTESPILTFGFITIPLMGAVVFATMLALAFFADRAERRQAQNPDLV